MNIEINKIDFLGMPNCLEMSNGIVKIILTTDVGPRVAFYGFCDGQNEFHVSQKDIDSRTDGKYHAFAGHRMWHGPQIEPRCCLPDDEPVEWEISDSHRVVLTEKTEEGSHMQKIMEVQLAEDSSEVTVTHRIINHGMWAVELTVWALTMMREGGVEVIPYSTRKTGLLHNRQISVWPWTEMNDPRLKWGKAGVLLYQDPNAPEVIPEENYKNAIKIGLNVDDGMIGYFNDDHLFIKKFSPCSGYSYPDGGCSCETYTDPHMLEMESLSPMLKLEPETEAVHVEKWSLFDHVPRPEDDLDAVALLRRYAGIGGGYD